jgi:hypothetical protein
MDAARDSAQANLPAPADVDAAARRLEGVALRCRVFALSKAWEPSTRISLANVRRVAMTAALAAARTSEAIA